MTKWTARAAVAIAMKRLALKKRRHVAAGTWTPAVRAKSRRPVEVAKVMLARAEREERDGEAYW